MRANMNVNIEQELAKATARVRELEFALAVERSVLERLKAIVSSNPAKDKPGSLWESSSKSADVSIRPGTLPDKARAVLLEAGQALPIAELARQVELKGAVAKGKADLKTLLTSAIIRCKAFVRLSPGIYDLAERQPQHYTRQP